jgi:hypothetical protein
MVRNHAAQLPGPYHELTWNIQEDHNPAIWAQQEDKEVLQLGLRLRLSWQQWELLEEPTWLTLALPEAARELIPLQRRGVRRHSSDRFGLASFLTTADSTKGRLNFGRILASMMLEG